MVEFLLANWLWILLIVVFVGMHRGGHGCGMHGGHGDQEASPEQTTGPDRVLNSSADTRDLGP